MNKILIAHRGNINGPNKERENTLSYIQEALDAGYNVECDIYFRDNAFWLGHNEPGNEKLEHCHLINQNLWLHAKDIETLYQLNLFDGLSSQIHRAHYFFHQEDSCTLISSKFIWNYPGTILTPFSIAVKPEGFYSKEELEICAGVCSDFIGEYKK